KALPLSLDKYYKTAPPEYLLKMFDMGEAMQGIAVNIRQGDMNRARESFKAFKEKYEASSGMVPEWRKYYDLKAIARLGSALEAGKTPEIFEAMGEVGSTCSGCHRNTMAMVWNRYNWKDFDKLKMASPNPGEAPLRWGEAKMKYLVVGFDGIGINIRNNNQAGAQQSFELFRKMFDNLNSTCSSCHAGERRYYVSGDIRAMITSMGEKINARDLKGAEELRHAIGMESCYGCHVLHMPAQYAKAEGK
ncbi:MAG TPA: hypothetical protein VIO11_03885, partial [Candidatus Methanoperedens sp.]